jgi:hypothetical protein
MYQESSWLKWLVSPARGRHLLFLSTGLYYGDHSVRFKSGVALLRPLRSWRIIPVQTIQFALALRERAASTNNKEDNPSMYTKAPHTTSACIETNQQINATSVHTSKPSPIGSSTSTAMRDTTVRQKCTTVISKIAETLDRVQSPSHGA